MDSSTKACESGERNKFKFNSSTYKHARRKHTAMLSRISKMGVFGILAFILAFGLVTTDATAEFNDDTMTVTATPAPTPTIAEGGRLRAGTSLTTLTFVYTTSEETAVADLSSTIKISFPAVGTSPTTKPFLYLMTLRTRVSVG